MKTKSWWVVGFVTAAVPSLAGLACVSEGGAPAGVPPDSSYVMQRVAGNAVVLPRGFEISVYADRLDGVRFLAVGPDGALYATQTGAGAVVRLLDGDGDGQADATQPIAAGLDGPHGIAFRGDTLYVAEETRILRFMAPYQTFDVVVEGLPGGGGHSTRTILFRDDHLFVSVGSSCNICDESDARRAAVVRYDLTGGDEHLYATGLRNSVGLALHPETGEIWATNNDRDRLGDDRPPDRVNILRDGGFYGWPQCYLPDTPNPEYQHQAERCSGTIGPTVAFPAHSAPLGLAFYTGSQFPSEYSGDLFVAFHGSWDRSFPTGYKVVRIQVDDGGSGYGLSDFITGWQVGRRSWGRPVDIVVAPDGSLYISDDQGGRIYRVTHSGS
jgi:glucose/arabinose dehydrogenase